MAEKKKKTTSRKEVKTTKPAPGKWVTENGRTYFVPDDPAPLPASYYDDRYKKKDPKGIAVV